MPEFRKDPVTGRWVIIAAERAKRPQIYRSNGARGDPGSCPFCPGNEAMTPPEVLAYRNHETAIDAPGWSVRVVPNKYPALVAEGRWIGQNTGLYESMQGLGSHEVIIETPDHIVNMATLDEAQIAEVLRAYSQRMLALREDARWRSILVYKNQGAAAGATLEHIHSQLIALPAVPQEIVGEVEGAKGHFAATQRCIYCEIIAQEKNDKRRIVAEHERFIAFCPFASRFPYETWIFPKAHESSFEEASAPELSDLARALKEILSRLDLGLKTPPFNYILHTNPRDGARNSYHWHMEIMPKLTQVAGFEWGSGCTINPLAPEDAASVLREVAI